MDEGHLRGMRVVTGMRRIEISKACLLNGESDEYEY